MKNYELPYFEQIDITALEGDYRTETTLNENKISIDINFGNKSIAEDTYLCIKAFLENIEKFNAQNRLLIENDFKENGEVVDYLNFYLDELGQSELASIIDINDNNNPKEKQLLDKLKLVRVGLYPDAKYDVDYFGVFDYSIEIDGEVCNQLLVVKTNEKGELDHLTWES